MPWITPKKLKIIVELLKEKLKLKTLWLELFKDGRKSISQLLVIVIARNASLSQKSKI
jgi:hypothetical protein